LSISSYDEDFTGDVVAPDFESYVVFAELLEPLIRNLHCVTATGELPPQPPTRFFHVDLQRPGTGDRASLESRDLDPSGRYIMAGIVECTRNLEGHQLPLTMRINELEEIERLVTSALMGPEMRAVLAKVAAGSGQLEGEDEEPGTYYTVSELLDPFSEVRARTAASGLLLPLTESEDSDERRLHGKHWPYGRGVYVNSVGNLAVWVNVRDHLRLVSCSSERKPGRVGEAYSRLAELVTRLDGIFRWKREPKLGFLTSRPCAIGNTLRFELVVKLAGLSRRPEDLKHLCVVRGLRIQPTLRTDTVRLGNQQSLSIDELQTYQDFDRALLNVITLEKEMALTSSHTIATVIAKIFKRRRLSGPRSIRF
jgi:arginine kinase